MIRRETQSPDGTPLWVLIDQVEHARVAGQLADLWDLGPLATPWQATLRWTATHHDDGWAAWDTAPALDAQGRPISFVEMDVADSNRIWAESIEVARRHSPWAGFLVARHFLELRAGGTSADDPAAIEFHDHFAPLADAWIAEGVTLDDVVPEIVRQSDSTIEWLQLFDWLSLLLCCGPLEKPQPLSMPGVTEMRLSAEDAWHLQLDPWPFPVAEVRVSAHGKRTAARSYADTQELCQAARPMTLQWRLTANN